MPETATTTIDPSIIEAMRVFGIEDRVAEVEAILDPHATYLGEVSVEGQVGGAWRSHTGPDDLTGRGGLRMYLYGGDPRQAEAGANKLSSAMLPKLWMRGLTEYRGGKGVVQLDASALSLGGVIEATRQYGTLMHDSGFGDYRVDGIAGDIGTNNTGVMDAYTHRQHELDPGNIYQATATGKSLENGGNAFRAQGTGREVYVALRELMRQRGETHASVSVQGGGNVGIWFAHHASQPTEAGEPKITVNALSDQDGIVFTEDATGLIVPYDTACTLGDISYRGPKAQLLLEQSLDSGIDARHRQETPSANILSYPVDYFVPAALPGVVNADTVQSLGARRGLVGGANNAVTRDAYEYLHTERPAFAELTGEIANGGGTDNSHIERMANIETALTGINTMPGPAETRAILDSNTARLMGELHNMSQVMGTDDLHLAAAGLFVARLFPGAVPQPGRF